MKVKVAITGGAGFLGQHLVREIQTRFQEKVSEIRIIDTKKWRKFIDFPENIPMDVCIADCADETGLGPLLEGVDTVFHLCGTNYSYKNREEKEKHWHSNFKATETVLDVARQKKVKYLVFVGDAQAYRGPMDLAVTPNECTTLQTPNSFYLRAYGESKFKAELLVRQADSEELRTIIVRPPYLYGEGDSFLAPAVIDYAKKNGGVLPRYDEHWQTVQLTYAGNCADLLLTAWCRLQAKPETLGSQVFFCNDGNGKSQLSFMAYVQPYLELAGCQLAKKKWSWSACSWILFLQEMVNWTGHWVGLEVFEDAVNWRTMDIIGGTSFCFLANKARLFLDWIPAYDAENAMDATLKWWKQNINS